MRPIPSRRGARAFTIVEVLVVLMIFAIVVAMATVVTRGVAAAQKRSTTTTRLAGVDAALIQFVATQKRLPCPADGTLASSAANAGVEIAPDATNGCTAQQNGVVPWRSLGISEGDATDGWDRRLTYRVWPVLGATGPPAGMDMSWCDPAGTEVGATPRACNTACVSTTLTSCTKPSDFLTAKGLTVQNVAGTKVMDPAAVPPTGAAYVVISPGETGGGGYLVGGTFTSPVGQDGDEEKKNYANLGVQAYYVDDTINDASGATHFDDVVSRPSVQTVATKAGIGPRAH